MADKNYRLKESKIFCMMPWTHLHFWPNGTVYPCCMTNDVVDDLNKSSLKEAWNSEDMKQLRLDMLADKPNKICNRCYELESNGGHTLRMSGRRKFAHHYDLVEKTNDDGSLDEMRLPYIDFRFSNICNFRCRTCGPDLSSSWYDDHVKIMPKHGNPKIIRPKNEDEIWNEIEPYIDQLEEIYFAGGEPLIMEEHYRILKKLAEKKLWHVNLKYNTNFSILKYKDLDVLDIWNQFKDVRVGASLDAMGERAEYIRKGTNWNNIVKNRKQMLERCPQVHFFISATISNMNVLHVPDMFRTWAEEGMIEPHNINCNILLFPPEYRIDTLTKEYKEKAVKKWQEHINWFKTTPSARFNNSQMFINQFESVINAIQAKENQDNLKEFKNRTKIFDKLRNESFVDIFPEMKDLWEEIPD